VAEPKAKPDPTRQLIGEIGGHISWANTEDRTACTAPARAAFDQRFLDQADGDPVRAAHLRKAHFLKLALKSAQSRRKAKKLTEVAEAADAELRALGANPTADPAL
jgi:hypothetical protein